MKPTCISARLARIIILLVVAHFILSGCATNPLDIRKWERSGDVTRLSEVTRDKSEKPYIRRLSLESLARLNWKPSNEERLEVFGLFASKEGLVETAALMQTFTTEQFVALDKLIVSTASLVTRSGEWTERELGKARYTELRAADVRAVTVSLCQQLLAHPELQVNIVLLGIKLGLPGSEKELVGVLFVYGDKTMAEDYLNSGSRELAAGGRRWANSHGYRVSTGYGSHRSGWGKF